ncbi:hypothetical protein HUT19_34655 [Streptomyces sp. NA02950]|uniref:hypothetical protein n=1 Tax=Streptomyces sp. NA02950 TaxID=2742137 RepID=UPI00158FBD07|nr:hypothetical protein [Streptomyces sp. NA02950]QKV96231.1 hypothetical protein HUT19_34655 [Streptomyces sp. NA02950]
MNRPLRITLLAVLAVALVAAGALGGVLVGREEGKDPKKFSEVLGDTCPTVLRGVPSSLLDRVVPVSRNAGGEQRMTYRKLSVNSHCTITVDGKEVLDVDVEQLNSVNEPRRAGTGPGHGKTKSIPGYDKSWSSQDAAGLNVACTKNTGNDNATNVYVRAQVWREPYGGLREDLVRMVKQAAKTGHALACSAVPPVPD